MALRQPMQRMTQVLPESPILKTRKSCDANHLMLCAAGRRGDRMSIHSEIYKLRLRLRAFV